MSVRKAVLSDKITKIALAISILAIGATVGAVIYFYPSYFPKPLLYMLIAELMAFGLLISDYLGKTEVHTFVFVDEDGRVVKLKKKRLKKSVKPTEFVEVMGFKFEINPINKIHVVPNFGETEAELRIDVNTAKAEAKMRERKATMLDLTVQALSKLFTDQQLLMLLIIISIALSAANLILTLLMQTGKGGG